MVATRGAYLVRNGHCFRRGPSSFWGTAVTRTRNMVVFFSLTLLAMGGGDHAAVPYSPTPADGLTNANQESKADTRFPHMLCLPTSSSPSPHTHSSF